MGRQGKYTPGNVERRTASHIQSAGGLPRDQSESNKVEHSRAVRFAALEQTYRNFWGWVPEKTVNRSSDTSTEHPADNVTNAGSELNTFGLTLAEMIAIGATVRWVTAAKALIKEKFVGLFRNPAVKLTS